MNGVLRGDKVLELMSVISGHCSYVIEIHQIASCSSQFNICKVSKNRLANQQISRMKDVCRGRHTCLVLSWVRPLTPEAGVFPLLYSTHRNLRGRHTVWTFTYVRLLNKYYIKRVELLMCLSRGLRIFHKEENVGSVGQRGAKLVSVKLWEWFNPGWSQIQTFLDQ